MVLDRNGKLIEDWSPAGHYHVTLQLKEMGAYAPKAVLAAEDRNFYSHGAIDPMSTARAAWVDITSGGLHEGGSTITQQLVKIQLLTPEKSITRKVQEVVLAVALEQRYSKDEILGMYLNRIYFGHGAYGVGAAARTYFNKDAKDISPAQAAFLAGLIQAPAAYDPLVHYDLAQGRELYVLQGMVATGALSPDEADKAAKEDIRSELHIQSTARQSKAPHFVDHVLIDLEKSFGTAAVQQGGIVVRTTLDIKASTAILHSRNIPAVQVGQMEGMNNVIDLAHAMGIKSKLEPYLSTAIGASVVTLYEHVQGYQTFANNGQRVDLRVINEVQDSSGHTVFKYENPSSTTVLTPAEAFLMTDVLKNYQNTWRFGWNRQMASKTGTSDNGKGGIQDSWIMAYNPDIDAGVWIA